ncbi:MAG: AAA family ATPase [Candidatus Eremiobacterota bacterium]
MSAVKRNLKQVWDQLRSQKVGRATHLDDVRIAGLRGIQDLRVAFPYPVSVLAGENGCGKSTLLFALACAYATTGRKLTPAGMFPDFRASGSLPSDTRPAASLEYAYLDQGSRVQMRWSRTGKGWSRSFFGRKGTTQPQRSVYLRTLANLTNPSEVRSVLQMGKQSPTLNVVSSAYLAFAQRVLSYRYQTIQQLNSKSRNLLFALRDSGESYSEFHMSAGERAVLRLSLDLSQLNGALVLIDEVEAGLHPVLQQLLMLELQRLSLRNDLQVVVTTHSPAVLETVPAEAKVFLERTSSNVVRREAYRDILERALFGRAFSSLSIVCEDDVAEALLRGLLDVVAPGLEFSTSDVQIGRDTGKEEFLHHLDTFARFRKLDDVVFVLDGDAADVKPRMESRAAAAGQAADVLVLPGSRPEEWLWAQICREARQYAPFFGVSAQELEQEMTRLDLLFSGASDKDASKVKNRLFTLADTHNRTLSELARHVGFTEAGRELAPLRDALETSIRNWRSRQG